MRALLLLIAVALHASAYFVPHPAFKALALYSTDVEPDHVLFANDALKFLSTLAEKDNFTLDASTDWNKLNDSDLKKYGLVLWLNNSPQKVEQRASFERYMDSGGAWLGFHFAGYNDKDTKWPWFVDFLGGAVFYANSWPPLPATLRVDAAGDPVTKHAPATFLSPSNEWYLWQPSPRLNKNVRVLLTLAPSNYPLGLKDVLLGGDVPVVWTNTNYRMVYMNMGHGDKILTDSTQNRMIEDTVLSLGRGPHTPVHAGTPTNRAAPPTARVGVRISSQGVVVNKKTDKVYVVNNENGIVDVIDSRTDSVKPVKVGVNPVAVAINEETNRIYVANAGSGTVTVIDGAANSVSATVPVGSSPYVVAVNPATDKIYVSNTFSNTITVIDGTTNATTALKKVVQADAMAVNITTNKIYLLSYESDSITVLNGETNAIEQVQAGTHLWGVAINPASGEVYLPNSGTASVAILDGAKRSKSIARVGAIPCAVAVDSVRNRIYVAAYGDGDVTLIDGKTDSAVGSVHTGAHPQAIAADGESGRVYLANTRENTVTVIDGITGSVISTVPAGTAPYALAIDEKTHKLYAADILGQSVTKINIAPRRN